MWQRTRSEIEIVLEARAVHALQLAAVIVRPQSARTPHAAPSPSDPIALEGGTGKRAGSAAARAVGRAHCARPPPAAQRRAAAGKLSSTLFLA